MAPVTRDQELWALALSIERKHGAYGPRVIAETIGRYALEGEEGAVDLWKQVAERYERLAAGKHSSPN